MLTKSTNALLISAQPDFSDKYVALAKSVGVTLSVESNWSLKFRVKEEVVILGGKHLGELNPVYYEKAVVILGEGESPAPYMKQGINRFIFNYKNSYELILALHYVETKVVVSKTSSAIVDAINDSGLTRFQFHDYDFKFDRGVFFYKDKPIYLTDGQRRYLAQWLLTGNKDNSKRMILCKLRKKFGEDFLSDIDRFGQPKRRIK